MEVEILKDEQEVLDALKKHIERISNEAIASRSSFCVGFSGGSLSKYLCNILPLIRTDWSKWKIFFCDERFVGEEDAESTFGFYKNNLLPVVPSLLEKQFWCIDVTLPIDEVASRYEKSIMNEVPLLDGIPRFDLLLLGVGPDGHIASLFPGHELLEVKDRLVAFITDSPKPPPKRITMTYQLINAAHNSIFAISGASKAGIIKQVLAEKEDLPAGKVDSEKVYWLLDEASALHIAK